MDDTCADCGRRFFHKDSCPMNIVELPCLYCGRVWPFHLSSPEANCELNVYCPGGECEDKHAATL